MSCAMCLENVDEIIPIKSNPSFHERCFGRWNKVCPLCCAYYYIYILLVNFLIMLYLYVKCRWF